MVNNKKNKDNRSNIIDSIKTPIKRNNTKQSDKRKSIIMDIDLSDQQVFILNSYLKKVLPSNMTFTIY
jgi:hypothetical protein